MCKKMTTSRGFSVVLVFLGISMMLYGYWSGEAQVVLAKAIRICMECIGIG